MSNIKKLGFGIKAKGSLLLRATLAQLGVSSGRIVDLMNANGQKAVYMLISTISEFYIFNGECFEYQIFVVANFTANVK